MAIIRPPQPTDGYFQVRRTWVRDPRTTYKGKGILAAILSHNEDWDLTTEQLIAQSSDGKAAVNSGLQELERVGYLRRVKMRRAESETERKRNGTFAGYDLILTEPPPYEEPARTKRLQPKQVRRVAATTTRKSDPGPDQGFYGSTTNRFSSAGSSSAGSSSAGQTGTKEEQGVENQGLENQVQNPPSPPALPDLSADATQPRGKDSLQPKPNLDEDLATRALISELKVINEAKPVSARWQYVDQRTRSVLREIADRHPFAVVRLALLALAHGDSTYGKTMSPRRLAEAGPWWDDAYTLYRSSPAGRTPLQRSAITDCPLCDRFGWLLEPGSTTAPIDPAVKCSHEREPALV